MRLSFTLTSAAVLTLAAAAPAQPPAPSLADNVRRAIADRRVQDSDNLGDPRRLPYRDVTGDGGVLVGFDVGLARFGTSDIPYALRPVYRAGDREWPGKPAGNFSSRQVWRTVRVAAKPGYAVGGLWVRSGGGLDRFCLHYFRVRDGGLDPADTYASDWVGTSDGGTERYLDGRGRPVVGLFADTSGDQARGFGVVYARVPPAPPKKADTPGPNADTPAPAPGTGEPVPGAGGKTKLAQEAEALRAQQEQPAGPDDLIGWMPFIGLAILAVPAALVGWLVLGNPQGRRSGPRDRAHRPVRDIEGQPLAERPALAQRLEPYLPAGLAKKRRPVGLPGEEYRKARTPIPDAIPVPVDRFPAPVVEIPKPVVEHSRPIQALPTPTPEDVPPFFTVRATYKARHSRLTRVYVLEAELIVIDAGPGADVNETAGFVAAAASGGGLVGALIGGAVGAMVADGQKARGAAFQQKLDQLDLPGLFKWAREDGNFRARFEDIVGLAIDPPPPRSFWKGQTKAAGTFRFRHLERGEFTFEFLLGPEIRMAIELLRRSAGGDQLHVGEGWDEATAPYLAGL